MPHRTGLENTINTTKQQKKRFRVSLTDTTKKQYTVSPSPHWIFEDGRLFVILSLMFVLKYNKFELLVTGKIFVLKKKYFIQTLKIALFDI